MSYKNNKLCMNRYPVIRCHLRPEPLTMFIHKSLTFTF